MNPLVHVAFNSSKLPIFTPFGVSPNCISFAKSCSVTDLCGSGLMHVLNHQPDFATSTRFLHTNLFVDPLTKLGNVGDYADNAIAIRHI